MTMPQITISPATTPHDHHALATLEHHTFHNDPFTIIAFGPLRSSQTSISRSAQRLSITRPLDFKGEVNLNEWRRVFKAVDEDGRIVGGAVWGFVVGRRRGDGETGEEDEGRKGQGEDWKQEDWGETANRRFCEDIFIKGDEIMERSTNGQDYAKLNALFVDPEYQRQGIGIKLLEEGLKEVDSLGLQCVLGASKEGEGLYRRFGWVDYEMVVVDLEKYGGVGMGRDVHSLMNRPARKKDAERV